MRSAIRSIRLSLLQCPRRQPFCMKKISMAHIFYLVAGITMVSVIVESRIHEEKEEAQDDYTWKQYCQDIREGFHYLKKEKGIRNIYTYMSITSGVSDGNTVLIQAFLPDSAVAYGYDAWIFKKCGNDRAGTWRHFSV